ncbi:uncharacterized protein LOC120285298 [Drosophila simulans]|uniref:uncharacterized protein LOC120285298 n=1 Tax=Drosophila simulans TaxID=7240 RepID=UPI00192D04D4|nr:uncharacterized protein LOC120285298 [Drosophila simulans]
MRATNSHASILVRSRWGRTLMESNEMALIAEGQRTRTRRIQKINSIRLGSDLSVRPRIVRVFVTGIWVVVVVRCAFISLYRYIWMGLDHLGKLRVVRSLLYCIGQPLHLICHTKGANRRNYNPMRSETETEMETENETVNGEGKV